MKSCVQKIFGLPLTPSQGVNSVQSNFTFRTNTQNTRRACHLPTLPSQVQTHKAAMRCPCPQRQAGMQDAWRAKHWPKNRSWPTTLCRSQNHSQPGDTRGANRTQPSFGKAGSIGGSGILNRLNVWWSYPGPPTRSHG